MPQYRLKVLPGIVSGGIFLFRQKTFFDALID